MRATIRPRRRIVEHLGITSVCLATNNPHKVESLRACGIQVVQVLALPSSPGPHNLMYLRTKRDRMGHRFAPPGQDDARPADVNRRRQQRRDEQCDGVDQRQPTASAASHA